MTAANAYSPSAPEGDAPSQRGPEPSMEDILASIRRIISDDHLVNARSNGAAVPSGARPADSLRRGVETPEPAQTAAFRHDQRVTPLSRPANPAPVEAALAPAAPAREFRSHLSEATSFSDTAAVVLTPFPTSREGASEGTKAAADAVASHFGPPLHAVSAPTVNVAPTEVPTAPLEPADTEQSTADRAPMSFGGAPKMESAPGPASKDDKLLSAPVSASISSAFEMLAGSVVLQNETMIENLMRELLRPLLKTWLDDHLPSLVERLVRGEIERVARGGR